MFSNVRLCSQHDKDTTNAATHMSHQRYHHNHRTCCRRCRCHFHRYRQHNDPYYYDSRYHQLHNQHCTFDTHFDHHRYHATVAEVAPTITTTTTLLSTYRVGKQYADREPSRVRHVVHVREQPHRKHCKPQPNLRKQS